MKLDLEPKAILADFRSLNALLEVFRLEPSGLPLFLSPKILESSSKVLELEFRLEEGLKTGNSMKVLGR